MPRPFRDSNLVNNAIYHYVVRAVSETGASAASNEAVAKTLTDQTAPTAPSNLQYAQSGGPTAVNLTWNTSSDNSGFIARYDIYVNGQKVYSSTTNSFQVTGLDSLAPYRFVVKAVDSSENVSVASNQVTYMPPGTVKGDLPGAPSAASATAVSYNSIQLNWTDNSSNENGFEIVRSETSGGTYVPVATIDKNVTEFTDSALVSSKTYFYKVRAIGNYGESAFTGPVSASTQASPATPIPPGQLTGQPGENNTISLNWTDNSSNENNFLVYRSTDNENFLLVATIPANSNAWTDTTVVASTNYYYYVAGKNGAGTGQQSNIAHVKAGNKAPVISSLSDIFVKATNTVTKIFTVADDPGDSVAVIISNKPGFVTVENPSIGEYHIISSPALSDIGSYSLTITAADNNGKSVTKTITITVGDKNTKSVYINFGSNGKSAPSPWNNWLGKRSAGNVLNGLIDESGTTTSISITTVNDWSGTTNMGHITGANSGVFPDAVLSSGLVDSSGDKQIKVGGLDISKQYNLVFVGSQNEGIMASASYTSGSKTSALNARYNTDQTANLNNLSPDINGEILVTISRTNGSPATYLSGFAIEEIDASTQLLNPNNLYAEVKDRNTIVLTWSDRTSNENIADGYELTRATDSVFSKNVQAISLPANTISYNNTGLAPNTKYWYRVRAKNGSGYSDYSNIVKAVTAETIVYVNFNFSVANAPEPWNNLESSPLFNFNTPNLKDQSGNTTNISMTLTKEFNGEFTAGVETAGNDGVAPPNVLKANYWLDREQLSQFKVNGLNHSKKYRFGFLGSSSPPVWFKGNYTAAYSINNRTVYLNSWENSSKIVYVGDVAPDADGSITLNFSTTPEAGYGFNSGVIIEEYADAAPVSTPIDTIPTNPVDTLPTNPVDTIPTNPVDTIPTNPVDTIPTNPGNPDPVDTIPNNPNPIDTIPTNPGNPDPVDTIPNNPNPIDTIPGTPGNPGDTVSVPNPSDSLANPFTWVSVYPNPIISSFNIQFYNSLVSDKIDVEIYDQQGRMTYRRNFGSRPQGNTVLEISRYETNMRTGINFVVLKINGEIKRTIKVLKNSK